MTNPALKQDIFKSTEHAAHAQLARIVRNSEAGWLFYSPGGTAYHVLPEEATTLQMSGHRRINRISWLVGELGKLPPRCVKWAFGLLAADIALAVSTGKKWQGEFGDVIPLYVFPTLILFALFFGFLRPFLAMILRSTMMLLWQRKEAKKLHQLGRGSVPAAIEEKHKRFNLFRLVFVGALAVLVTRFVFIWFMTPSQLAERGFLIDLACLTVMSVTMIPARLVDLTHIRRKWFD